MSTRFDGFKYETVSSIYMKLSTFNSNKTHSSYDQPSDDLIKYALLNSPEKYSHESQFTKHLSSATIEGDTLLQIKKWWDAILSAFYKYLSTNNRWPAYKYLRAEYHNIYSFLLPPDIHPKFSTE